jgi:hypothetical protein
VYPHPINSGESRWLGNPFPSSIARSIAMRFAAGLLAIPFPAGVGGLAHGAPAADDWLTVSKDSIKKFSPISTRAGGCAIDGTFQIAAVRSLRRADAQRGLIPTTEIWTASISDFVKRNLAAAIQDIES